LGETEVLSKPTSAFNRILINNMQEVADWSELIVLTTNDKIFKELKINHSQVIIDLVRIPEFINVPGYEGISW